MRTLTRPGKAAVQALLVRVRGGLLSTVVHTVVLLGMFGVLHTRVRLAPYKLPGTAQGFKLLTYYSPGSPDHAGADVPLKKVEKHTLAKLRQSLSAPRPKSAEAPSVETGTGNAQESGLGEGDIKIALQKVFAYPKPDLSVLPHKTAGDVILDAVIDERGNISNLTLLKGLGPSIDDVVIATVKQWSYTPATRNGIAIPSEQELHFHFERG